MQQVQRLPAAKSARRTPQNVIVPGIAALVLIATLIWATVAGGWFGLSAYAFVVAAIGLCIAFFVFFHVVKAILPLLAETREQIQDLGDLATNTTGRAAETMDLVELRVSQAMGQATQAGIHVSRQALGIGTVMAGVYLVSRVTTMLRKPWQMGRRRKRRR